jgi:hypothetical protein
VIKQQEERLAPSDGSAADCAVDIVNHNNRRDSATLLGSLGAAIDGPFLRTIVVDNGSARSAWLRSVLDRSHPLP